MLNLNSLCRNEYLWTLSRMNPVQPVKHILKKEQSQGSLVKVNVAQLCPTLCDPMDYTVYGIL